MRNYYECNAMDMGKRSRSSVLREYVRKHYIEPACRRSDASVQISAGDVYKTLGLWSRASDVCRTLRSKKFTAENRLELTKSEGSLSLLTFTHRIAGIKPSYELRKGDAFLRLRGIAAEIFRDLGGGEAFIRGERERFYGGKESA